MCWACIFEARCLYLHDELHFPCKLCYYNLECIVSLWSDIAVLTNIAFHTQSRHAIWKLNLWADVPYSWGQGTVHFLLRKAYGDIWWQIFDSDPYRAQTLGGNGHGSSLETTHVDHVLLVQPDKLVVRMRMIAAKEKVHVDRQVGQTLCSHPTLLPILQDQTA